MTLDHMLVPVSSHAITMGRCCIVITQPMEMLQIPNPHGPYSTCEEMYTLVVNVIHRIQWERGHMSEIWTDMAVHSSCPHTLTCGGDKHLSSLINNH